MTAYVDDKGRRLFVSSGIGRDIFMTFWRKPTGSLKRLVSKAVPPRPSREQAQADLDQLAARRGWKGEPDDR